MAPQSNRTPSSPKDAPPKTSPRVSQTHKSPSSSTVASSVDASPNTTPGNSSRPPSTCRVNKQKISALPKDAIITVLATANPDGTTTLIATGVNVDFHHRMEFKSKEAFEKSRSRIMDRKLRKGNVLSRAEDSAAEKDKGKGMKKQANWSGTDLRRHVLKKRKREMEAASRQEEKAGEYEKGT